MVFSNVRTSKDFCKIGEGEAELKKQVMYFLSLD